MQPDATAGSDDGHGVVYGYDPRFAMTEFTASLFLREGQVKLVQQCVAKARGNQSLVTQMIMGAGKTTVILPLLALLLAGAPRAPPSHLLHVPL